MASLPGIDDWAEGTEENINEIYDCYCPNCEGSKAKTVMLPTKVPMFREIYIMSLNCPDCGFKNTEVNFGGEIQNKGEKISLKLTAKEDLDRQLIKSDSASIYIPQLQLEIPTTAQRGTISTIEGVLQRTADNLESLQPERLKVGDVDNFHRCRTVISKLRKFSGHPEEDSDDDEEEGTTTTTTNDEFEPYEIILDDLAGNSFIENIHAPSPDPNMTNEKYTRTARQDMALGLQPSKEAIAAGTIDDDNVAHKNQINDGTLGKHGVDIDDNLLKKSTSTPTTATTTSPVDLDTDTDVDTSKKSVGNLGKQESLKFATSCPSCYSNAETTMCVTDIPHFKEVIIMSLLCEHCGYKSNEIKGGGAIPKFGTRIILRVENTDDLAREVLKSDTSGIEIPEIELELDEGGLDGLYTTIEGLMQKLHDRLKSANPFGTGDAAKKQHLTNDGGSFSEPSLTARRYLEFLDKLQDLKNGKGFPFTLIINDPLSNSFVGPVPADAIALSIQAEKEDSNECYQHYEDKGMDIQEYERTFEQNEILGINDMKTENYLFDSIDEEVKKYYGTDQAEELPDRLRRLDIRGPDHPHTVAKAPLEGDDTVMGPGSKNFATPALAQRGKKVESGAKPTVVFDENDVFQKIQHHERIDNDFIMCEEFDGAREGMVFKVGKQGVGYYTDIMNSVQ